MPFDALTPRAATWRASLDLDFERRGERSVLAARRHEGPLVVQKALYPEGQGLCHAIVVHPPAGIAGGDDLSIGVRARDGASALLTTPGAAKWYRSTGAWARQAVRIDAGTAAEVEWLPQENIIYDGALAELSWEARLAADARLIAWDIFCLGRSASGERFERGCCRIATRVFRDGRLAWLERGRIDPGSRVMRSAAALDGLPVFGTMVAAAPRIGDEVLAGCREECARRRGIAVSRLPGLLLARYRGDSTQEARAGFVALWARLREPLLGRAAVEPRIWRT